MNADDDYCELCDLPRSQCIHGRPPSVPAKATTPPVRPKKPATSTRSSTRTTNRRQPPPGRRVPRRWTPPEAFKPLILTVLEEAGGELEADDLFLELEVRMEDQLLPGDSETTPEGELRWRYAARRARMALVAEGLMTRGRPGVWQLA